MSTDIVKSETDILVQYSEQQQFLKEHGMQLKSVESDYKSLEQIFDLIDNLPEDLPQKEHLYNVLQRLNPNKKGVVSDRGANFHTDLRIFQGTGNDPNRPSTLLPGGMYYSAGDAVGDTFVGTPLFIWAGRELVDKPEGDEMGKRLCISYDRTVGNYHGYCKDCIYLPWRKDVKNDIRCTNFINAFLLSQDGKEIVLARFNRTSEPAGRQLLQFAQRTPSLWFRWYKITTESQVSNDKKKKWYVYKVEPISGDEGRVSPKLHPVCEALYAAAGKEYVFPLIARTYADMSKERTANAPENSTAGVATESTDTGLNYSNINEDA